MFNIIYNVMIRLINCERFSINEDKYPKITDGMRRATFKDSNYSTILKAKPNPPNLPQ
jgi:hypothetical protein